MLSWRVECRDRRSEFVGVRGRRCAGSERCVGGPAGGEACLGISSMSVSGSGSRWSVCGV